MTGAETEYLVSIGIRTVGVLLSHLVVLVVILAARNDGRYIAALAWWVGTSLWALDWYAVASLTHWSGCCPTWLPLMWQRSWVVWLPFLIASAHAVHVFWPPLVRQLPRPRPPAWWR